MRRLLKTLANQREADSERRSYYITGDDGTFRLNDFERWLAPYAKDLPESRFAPFVKPYPRMSNKEIATLVARAEEAVAAAAAAEEPDLRLNSTLIEDVVRDFLAGLHSIADAP